jgi:hypothetical protein
VYATTDINLFTFDHQTLEKVYIDTHESKKDIGKERTKPKNRDWKFSAAGEKGIIQKENN